MIAESSNDKWEGNQKDAESIDKVPKNLNLIF